MYIATESTRLTSSWPTTYLSSFCFTSSGGGSAPSAKRGFSVLAGVAATGRPPTGTLSTVHPRGSREAPTPSRFGKISRQSTQHQFGVSCIQYLVSGDEHRGHAYPFEPPPPPLLLPPPPPMLSTGDGGLSPADGGPPRALQRWRAPRRATGRSRRTASRREERAASIPERNLRHPSFRSATLQISDDRGSPLELEVRSCRDFSL